MFIHVDPAKRSQVEALLQHCHEELTTVLEQIRDQAPIRAIGTSGTMENLAATCGGGTNSQGLRKIELKALNDIVDKLRKSTAAQRVKIRGLDEKRQDQILAGALLVQFLMQELGLRQILLSRSALREGILLEYIGRHLPDLAIRREVPDPRRRSVLDLARKCEWHEHHSQQVGRITLRLFDDLTELHKLGRKARELIEYGALLHDIGWHISSDAHHKHSMYLVQHGGLKGFRKDEIATIANITRYHRKSIPKPTHDVYVALSAADRRIVDVGGALLRIADGLDRSHCRVVSNLRCEIGKREVKVYLRGRQDMELELWAARRKTDMFKSTFGRDIVFLEDGREG
jgi:exopolyphosphatase/guanosine-5'-triphosphate,3'-diphosphate pyrophosphatase